MKILKVVAPVLVLLVLSCFGRGLSLSPKLNQIEAGKTYSVTRSFNDPYDYESDIYDLQFASSGDYFFELNDDDDDGIGISIATEAGTSFPSEKYIWSSIENKYTFHAVAGDILKLYVTSGDYYNVSYNLRVYSN